MPQKFFITHSHRDNVFARRLCDDLQKQGLGGFFDIYSIHPGDNISAEIDEGLKACDVYVPILSFAALKSDWCKDEIHTANTLSKRPGRIGRPRIIPILVEDCHDEMPAFLQARLYINFAGRYDEALSELLMKGFGINSKPPQNIDPLPSPPQKPVQIQTLPSWFIPAGIASAVIIVVCVLVSFVAGSLTSSPTSVPPTKIVVNAPIASVPTPETISALTVTPIPTGTNTPKPTDTPKPTAIFTPKPTDTPRPTPIQNLGIGSSKISPIDGVTMMYVPVGEFAMGSDSGGSDEKPVHTLYLDAFWIDKFEATNALYKKCVDAGKCLPSNPTSSYTRSAYYGNSQFDNFPVIYVSWDDANKYCTWVGKKLPTEAQWEKAARGMEGRVYPWGNTFDIGKLNSYGSGKGDTISVGSYLAGASPYGAMDMAGNVWEWVADWYGENYYASSQRNNPTGPTSGQYRVLRGGPWDGGQDLVRAANRFNLAPDYRYHNVGFRCIE